MSQSKKTQDFNRCAQALLSPSSPSTSSSIQLIPVIVKYQNIKGKESITNRFMMSKKMKLLQVQQNIRSKLKIKETEGLFFFVGNNQLQSMDTELVHIFEKNKNEKGMLEITCKSIEKFG